MTRASPFICLLAIALLFQFIGCHGDDKPIQHLILLDNLPVSLDRSAPLVLNIRSDYKGVVEFQESDRFQVLMNITAPSVGDAYMVHHEVVSRKGELLLQVYKSPPSPWIPHITLYKILAAILVLAVLVLILCLIAALWWYNTRRASEDMWKDRGLDDSAQQQPLMYRSRNSMQLATQSGDILVCSGDEDATNEDVLHHVPEVPEDDESIPLEALKRSPKKQISVPEERHMSSEDEDHDRERRLSKERFESPARKIHKDIAKQKKQQSILSKEDNVDYSDQSSELSHHDDYENERANQMAGQKQGRMLYNSHSHKMMTFHPQTDKPHQQISDAEVYNTGSLRRYENMQNLPSTVPRMVSPADEKKDFLSHQSDQKLIDAIMSKEREAEQDRPKPETKAFENKIYGSRAPPGGGLKGSRKGEYIYVNDVPPSYASHSDYPVHVEADRHGNKLAPGYAPKDYYPPSPSISNKEAQYYSDSGQSASIADSSDVFEENTAHPMFHDVDSDVEVPPIDMDDFPSSYMPGSLRLQQKLAESPEKKPKKPTLVVIPRSKEQPSTAPKLVTFQQLDTSPARSVNDNSLARKSPPSSATDPSVKKPPIPPPPHNSGYHGNSQVTQNGSRPSGTGTGSGSRGPSALRNIHVAIVCSFCMLGLITGVYCQLLTETEVKLLVLAPPGFLSNQSAVYFNKHHPGEVRAEHIRSSVQWFEVSSARLLDVNSTQCKNHLCPHGCDANTGGCICLRGYRSADDGRCVNVDECYEGWAKCSPYASCQDTQGSYRCICGHSYYGDGFTCKACKSQCKEGTFEVQPCAAETKQQKICKACTELCHEGFYMQKTCTPTQDSVCRTCQPRCDASQYEHAVCFGNQSRECRGRKINVKYSTIISPVETCTTDNTDTIPCSDFRLKEYGLVVVKTAAVCSKPPRFPHVKERRSMPEPQISDNVLIEDLNDVKDHTFGIRQDKTFDITQNNTFKICRGSNLTVSIELKEVRISPQLEPVDFSSTVGRGSFLGLPKIVSDFCPRPLPRYYKLSARTYKDVTYKVGQTCSHSNCRTEPKRCETFRMYGNFPRLQRRYDEFTLVCTDSGPLSHLFGVNQELTAATSFRAEISNSCASRLSECDNCTRECARQVSRDKNECEVKGDNGDNGWSPRLQSCYTCCVKPNCMEICQKYSLADCSPEMCRKGSLVEFKLEPIYSRAFSEFFCNVKPVKNQLLVRFEYSVTHKGQLLNKKSVSLFADSNWLTSGYTKQRDELLDFEVISHVTGSADIISGDITTPTYSAGNYRRTGAPVTPSGQSTIFLHPRTPFEITPSMWKESVCSDDIAAKALKVSKRDIPVIAIPEFRVNIEGRQIFSITNKTTPPQLKLHLGAHMSVLAGIYPRTEISYETLTGSISHNNNQWLISIEGHVTSCPGVLSVNVSDTNYKDQPLFMYDILVKCPRSFRLTSRLPTADHASVGRDFTVSVRDANKTIHLMLHRPRTLRKELASSAASALTEASDETEKDSAEETAEEADTGEFPFSVPFVAAVCGAIVLLLFMAAFGIFITPGEPNTEEVSHFEVRHLVFAVVYFTFQFLYCLFVSLTTFVLIWIALNSQSVSFIQQYQHQTVLQKALNSLELDKMQNHLLREMGRQSVEANTTKSTCDLEIRKIITSIEKEKQALSLSSTPDLWKEMSDKLKVHTNKVVTEFSEQLTRARDNYNYYANYLMEKLVFDIQQSYVSLASSRWLDGAKFLHGTVRNIRTLLKRQDNRPFMEWMGLESSFSQFAVGIDLSMPKPPMPVLEDFVPGSDSYQPTSTQSVTSSFAAVPPIVHVYNLWFNGDSDKSIAPVYRSIEKANSTSGESSQKTLSFKTEIMIFVILMAAIDLLWLVHRAVKAYRVSRLLLCGYPLYVDCSENKGETSTDRAQQCPPVTCCLTQKQNAPKRLITKTLTSLFIPKLVAMVMVCLMVYVAMVMSSKLVRKETLAAVGYYNDVENLLALNKKMVNKRLEANAERINTVEYPVYQDLLNMYVKRHLVLLEMIRRQHIADNITSEDTKLPPFSEGFNCQFAKIQARLYQRKPHTEDLLIDQHADPLLQAVRKMVADTCFLILLFLAVVALKQLLSMVIWLYVKRAGLIHLWIIYETNADEIRVQER